MPAEGATAAQGQPIWHRILPLARIGPYLRPYRLRISLILGALTVSALTTLSIGPGVGILVDSGLLSGEGVGQLPVAIAVMLTLALVLAISTWVRYYNVSWLGERVSADLREKVFSHLVDLHPGFFESERSGDLQSRFTTDTTVLQSVVGSSVSIVLRNLVMCLGGILTLFWLNPRLATAVLLVIPALVLPVLVMARRVKRLSRTTQDRVGVVGRELSEVTRHIKTVQAYNRQNYHRKRFHRGVDGSFRAAISMIRQRSWIVAVVIFLSMSSLALLVVLGSNEVIEGRSTAGDLIAFIFIAFMVAGAAGMISETVNDLVRAAGAMERLTDLMKTRSELPLDSGQDDTDADPMPRGEGLLEVVNVVFRYPQRPAIKVLDGFSMQARRGELTALVGLSGAGKSTLFDLLLRMYDWEEGEILLDGVDIRSLNIRSLRSCIGLVRQETPILDGTIRENIAYGREGVDDQQVQQAAQVAYADEFIRQLPAGIMTEVGESGATLSAGQRQRINIARALVGDPEILLLDEATSHLDAGSEAMIQEALDNLARSRTTVVIAHRLSTVLNAGRIHFVRAGRVEATGTHNELLEASQSYRKLVQLQFAAPAVPAGADQKANV